MGNMIKMVGVGVEHVRGDVEVRGAWIHHAAALTKKGGILLAVAGRRWSPLHLPWSCQRREDVCGGRGVMGKIG